MFFAENVQIFRAQVRKRFSRGIHQTVWQDCLSPHETARLPSEQAATTPALGLRQLEEAVTEQPGRIGARPIAVRTAIRLMSPTKLKPFILIGRS